MVLLRIAILVIRLLAWISSVVILASIASGGQVTDPFTTDTDQCIFHRVAAACGFGEAVGAMGLVGGLVLIALDVLLLVGMLEDKVGLINWLGVGLSGFLALFSFISFGVLFAQWNNNTENETYIFVDLAGSKSAANNAIDFSLVAALSWTLLIVLGIIEQRQTSGSANIKT